MSRAETSENTFAEAAIVANANGMRLRNPSAGHYQLRCLQNGWIVNLYPRRSGFSPRAYHDPSHRGPYLILTESWTLAHAVSAAITAGWGNAKGGQQG